MAEDTSLAARFGRPALVLLALVVLTYVALLAAGEARPSVVFDIGPSTAAYGAGFTESEERPPTTFRFTRGHARLQLPLESKGGTGEIAVRLQGTHREPTPLHVHASGHEVATLLASAGPFRVTRTPVTLTAGALELDLVVEGDADPGVAVDWIALQGLPVHVQAGVWQPALLVGGVFLLSLAAGLPLRHAALAALAILAAEAAWAAVDPFGLAHVAARIVVPALAIGGLALVLFRRDASRALVLLLVLGSYLLRGTSIFYPSYFYNDVRNSHRYVQALAGREGSFIERGQKAQVDYGVAYPRTIAGRKYAFPYSPVYFLPFTLLPQDPTSLDEAMKHVAAALSTAEVLLVFWMARALGGGATAALLAATLPIIFSRLLLTLWATLGGHFLDDVMIAGALALALAPEGRLAAAAFYGGAFMSLVTYVTSLFNVTLFAGWLAVFDRKRSLGALLAWGAGVGLALGLLYRRFVSTFVTEILPGVAASGATAADETLFDRVLGALNRIGIFYGVAYPLLAIAGFSLLRRQATPPVRAVLSAYAVAFASLLAMRCLPGGMFRDLKELEFVAPLMALATGAFLERLATAGASGRWAARLVTGGLMAWGLAVSAGYFQTWTALAER